MPLTHYSKFSMFTLRIWVFKSGVLKNVFILSKHGTKANIRRTKMSNNRHAYNRDVLQIRVITKLPNSEQSYKGKDKTHNYINRQNQSTTENCENRNDPDLVQAFLKKWWVESDFKAPNLPLSLRFKGSKLLDVRWATTIL